MNEFLKHWKAGLVQLEFLLVFWDSKEGERDMDEILDGLESTKNAADFTREYLLEDIDGNLKPHLIWQGYNFRNKNGREATITIDFDAVCYLTMCVWPEAP
ncbi:unnamed protein product [Caenorhabditis sp. 36 PRJEB53466]|nr:unnamed protein product [Caenorhabditis sp. 36 PRJEB53466]